MKKNFFGSLIFILLVFYSAGCAKNSENLSQYIGRYGRDSDKVVYIAIRNGVLVLRPIFWRSIQPLLRIERDSFVVSDRKERQAIFQRDEKGKISSLKVLEMGIDGCLRRLDDHEFLPVELLFAGQVEQAVEKFIEDPANDIEDLVNVGRNLFSKFPSKAGDAAKFLSALIKYYPDSSKLYGVLGHAYVAARERDDAIKSFKKAYQLNPKNDDARIGLQRVGKLKPDDSEGWEIPFSLDELFEKPKLHEIRAVLQDWKKRDLSVKDLKEVLQGAIDFRHTRAQVKIVSHIIHGERHYGAIITPEKAEHGSCPVILELKGVSWRFTPLDLNTDLFVPRILKKDQGRFITVVPSFRGEVLRFNGVEYKSEGDPTDSWDGATDDALTLLNAALRITPEADSTRICAFGRSRGGSVALLAGIRDTRIGWVLDWTGPVDWFELMGLDGWSQKELISIALHSRALPPETGGQFIRRFLKKAIQGERNLNEIRHRMIASSPIYFIHHLLRLQIHYGIEDEIVPIANGQALVEGIKSLGREVPYFEFYFHPNAGHDLDRSIAFNHSRDFLLAMLQN